MAGYSGTPLVRKLGIKPRERVVTINRPANYRELLAGLPEGVVVANRTMPGATFVHLFVTDRSDLARELKRLRREIDEAGTVWVSWPKKSSRVTSDVTEDAIRAEALPLGFVDVKVCAVDETWSGLKLMIRRSERAAK
ncbi:MAG: DUF3052 domain-containing protein [Chthoniobacterales bacterium]